MEALSKRLSEVGFGVRVRISVFVSSEINAKTPHEYNLHRKNEFLVLVFNFKVKYYESTPNHLPNPCIWSLIACLLSFKAIHSGNRSITCAHFIDCIFQSHIKLLGCSVMRSKPSRMCMTWLECFQFDLIYWMFLGNVRMSADPKEPIQSIGFQRIFHSDKSRNFLRFICVKTHLNFRLSFQFKGMLWKKKMASLLKRKSHTEEKNHEFKRIERKKVKRIQIDHRLFA